MTIEESLKAALAEEKKKMEDEILPYLSQIWCGSYNAYRKTGRYNYINSSGLDLNWAYIEIPKADDEYVKELCPAIFNIYDTTSLAKIDLFVKFIAGRFTRIDNETALRAIESGDFTDVDEFAYKRTQVLIDHDWPMHYNLDAGCPKYNYDNHCERFLHVLFDAYLKFIAVIYEITHIPINQAIEQDPDIEKHQSMTLSILPEVDCTTPNGGPFMAYARMSKDVRHKYMDVMEKIMIMYRNKHMYDIKPVYENFTPTKMSRKQVSSIHKKATRKGMK